MTIFYPAFLDGEKGGYGLVFPDLDGIAAMGETVQTTLMNAQEALHDAWSHGRENDEALAAPSAPEDITCPPDATQVLIPLVEVTGKKVRANLQFDAGVLDMIDTQAKAHNLTRTAYLEYVVKAMTIMGA